MNNDLDTWTRIANDLANHRWAVNGRAPLAGDIPHLIWLLGPMLLDQKKQGYEAGLKEGQK